jgi:TonB family protein
LKTKILKSYFLLSFILIVNVHSQDGIIKTFYGKGKISSRVSFVDNILEGTSYWYFENGNLQTEKNYSNGKLEGIWRNFYQSGLLKDEVHYSDGILDGVSKFYYENGALKQVKEFNKGKLVSESNIDYDSNYVAPISAYQAGMKKKNFDDNDILCEADICPQPIGGIEEITSNIVYPDLAKKFNLEGNVLLSAKITEKGDAKNVKVIKGIGLGCDEAAIDAVKKTRFIPGEKKGENVETEITFSIPFKLSENKTKIISAAAEISDTAKSIENNSKQFITCEFEECPKPIGGITELLKNLRYPPQAKRNNISGDVEVKAKINDLGFVISVEVTKGIGYGCDEAAKSLVIKTEFIPAKNNGKPIECETNIIIPFILDAEK